MITGTASLCLMSPRGSPDPTVLDRSLWIFVLCLLPMIKWSVCLVLGQVVFCGDPEAALIQYTANEEARRAISSTEAVLNNRFIRVYWHRENTTQNQEQITNQSSNLGTQIPPVHKVGKAGVCASVCVRASELECVKERVSEFVWECMCVCVSACDVRVCKRKSDWVCVYERDWVRLCVCVCARKRPSERENLATLTLINTSSTDF